MTGKNLDCAVIIEQDDKRYMPEVVSYQPHLVKPKQILFLSRQSDAQAQIAALEAEVVCLREALDRIRLIPFSMMDLPAGIMHGIAHKALKGGAA